MKFLQKSKKYFGDIPPGPSLVKPVLNIAKRTEDTRGYYEDRVPEAKITMEWNVPQWGSREADTAGSGNQISCHQAKIQGFTKNLYMRIRLSAVPMLILIPWKYPETFILVATVKQGKSAEEVEKTMNDILQEFLEKGPTQDEAGQDKIRIFFRFSERY